jgi:DNA-binding MarR family transcriptional regulator
MVVATYISGKEVSGMATGQIQRKVPAPEEHVYVGVVRLSDRMGYSTAALLKEHGLSGPQYNVLRILRGAGDEGLPCRKIAQRLITRVPDITRLLDRLEAAGNVTRERGAGEDRRVVLTKITPAGLEKLRALDQPIEDAHRDQLSALSNDEIQQLNALLSKALESEGSETKEDPT